MVPRTRRFRRGGRRGQRRHLRLRGADGRFSEWSYASAFRFASSVGRDAGEPGPRPPECDAEWGCAAGWCEWAVAHMRGCRPRMEDAHAAFAADGHAGMVCFGVFDGHGDNGVVARAAATGDGLGVAPADCDRRLCPACGAEGRWGVRRKAAKLGGRLLPAAVSAVRCSACGGKAPAEQWLPPPQQGPSVFDAVLASAEWRRGDGAAAIAQGVRATDALVVSRLRPPPLNYGACALLAFVAPPPKL